MLRRKYLNACFMGDVDTVEYMVKKERKNFKSFRFLEECLKMACEGSASDNRDKDDSDDDHINVCKIICGYKRMKTFGHYAIVVSGACLMGKLNFVEYYLDIIPRELFFVSVNWVYESCESGNINLVKFIINLADKYKVGWNSSTCLKFACLSGNMECVTLFIDKDTHNINWEQCFTTACQGGNLEIVKLTIEKGAKDFFNNLPHAANGGNVDIVKFILDKCGDGCIFNYEKCLVHACSGDSLEVIKFIIEEKLCHVSNEIHINDIEICMLTACHLGMVEIIKYLIENGAKDWNRYAWMACVYCFDNVKIIKFMIEKGADNFGRYLPNVCSHGYLDLVHELVEKGADDWNGGLIGACRFGHTEIVRFMIECGATNLNYCMKSIHGECDIDTDADIYKLLISNGADEFDYLSETSDFQLHCIWLRHKGMKCNRYDNKWMKLIEEHPSCVLLVGSLCSKSYCSIKRLPTELFTLLTHF